MDSVPYSTGNTTQRHAPRGREPVDTVRGLLDLKSAQGAFVRALPDMDAPLDAADFSPMNVDLVNAVSTILYAADRMLTFREDMARLDGFDIKHLDNLAD